MPITQFTFDSSPATKVAEQRGYFQEVKAIFDTDDTIINYTDIEESHIMVVLNNGHSQKCNGSEQENLAREAIKNYDFKIQHPNLVVVKAQSMREKKSKDKSKGRDNK